LEWTPNAKCRTRHPQSFFSTLLARRRDPALASRLRVIESWGPMPFQPVLAHSGIARVLLSLDADPVRRAGLEEHGVRRFAAVDESSRHRRAKSRSRRHAGALG
jgi:hypothetical protein